MAYSSLQPPSDTNGAYGQDTEPCSEFKWQGGGSRPRAVTHSYSTLGGPLYPGPPTYYHWIERLAQAVLLKTKFYTEFLHRNLKVKWVKGGLLLLSQGVMKTPEHASIALEH